MLAGGQYDGCVDPHIPLSLSLSLSLSLKCFVNLTSFILVTVKHCVSFYNPQYFCLSISLQGLILLVITISP